MIMRNVQEQKGTPRAPDRACLSLLPSGPGEVRRVIAARGVERRVYGRGWSAGAAAARILVGGGFA
ncbi:MAG: hypothetical protein QOI69_1582 [Pseudonocardiales bacterium]|nr:hypothetical protein [Pseudonocardiales bacterium]